MVCGDPVKLVRGSCVRMKCEGCVKVVYGSRVRVECVGCVMVVCEGHEEGG